MWLWTSPRRDGSSWTLCWDVMLGNYSSLVSVAKDTLPVYPLVNTQVIAFPFLTVRIYRSSEVFNVFELRVYRGRIFMSVWTCREDCALNSQVKGIPFVEMPTLKPTLPTPEPPKTKLLGLCLSIYNLLGFQTVSSLPYGARTTWMWRGKCGVRAAQASE